MTYYAMEVASTLGYLDSTAMTSATDIATVLAGVQILAMANHPSLPHIIYTLYGIGVSVYTQYVL